MPPASPRRGRRRLVRRGGTPRILLALLATLVVTVASVLVYALTPYPLPKEGVIVDIEPGGLRGVGEQLYAQGLGVHPAGFWLIARLSGQAGSLKAGRYAFAAGSTPWSVVGQMARGDVVKVRVTLVEGWRFRDFRAALAAEPGIRNDTLGLDDASIMAELGQPGVAAEGRFLPDTYVLSYGSSDRVVLRMAFQAMQRALDEAWTRRQPDLRLRSPDEALVLASIIEKETGVAEERGIIAGVFHNRLRIGMRLQTDPTVIYGMGAAYSGRLRRADLERDTPWNTYTRAGLPPTPIAMPGRASLLAAVQPDTTRALYFVANGHGGHVFSETLEEHNRQVQRWLQALRQSRGRAN